MKKNVLLVEDDPALRMVMREVLKDDYSIDEADNGLDGIAKAIQNKNDLIILDYHLPKKDGIEVIAAIRDSSPNVPVIVLTGYLNPESEEKFNKYGANKIFPKPFNYKALLDTVKSLTLRGQADTAHTAQTAEQTEHFPLGSCVLQESLDAMANIAEKVEFLQSLTEKYWIEPSDIVTIRETARCMESQIRQYYGAINQEVFESGNFDAEIVKRSAKPYLSFNN